MFDIGNQIGNNPLINRNKEKQNVKFSMERAIN